MKITIISDTHTRHTELTLPGGDLLIHCGDFMSSGLNSNEAFGFVQWLDAQDYTTKVFIAGNHDQYFENFPLLAKDMVDEFDSVHYLQDSLVVIDGVKIYGTPWSPEYMGWAFALKNSTEAKKKFDKIPFGTDILISHSPPFGVMDVIKDVPFPVSLGSLPLLNRGQKIKPALHCFGHIHSSQGWQEEAETLFVNAACLGEDYCFSNTKRFMEIEMSFPIKKPTIK